MTRRQLGVLGLSCALLVGSGALIYQHDLEVSEETRLYKDDRSEMPEIMAQTTGDGARTLFVPAGMDGTNLNSAPEITVLEAEGVPTIYLDLQKSADIDWLFQKRLNRNKAKASFSAWNEDGTMAQEMSCEVKGHGNTSWFDDKHSFQISFTDAESVLSCGPAQKWLLIAGMTDPSYLENRAAYAVQQKLGVSYAQECQYVNVYVNRQYVGLYLLIQKTATGDDAFMELCGELTAKEADQYFETANRHVVVRAPKSAGAQTLRALSETVNRAEEVLYSTDAKDASFEQYFDTTSWVQQYLLQEYFYNGDTELNSEYFHLSEDGLLIGGPGWDFDRSFTAMGAPDQLELEQNSLHVEGLKDASWLKEFYRHKKFQELLTTYYRDVFSPAVHEVYEVDVPTWLQEIQSSARMDHVLYYGSDLDEDQSYVLDWMEARMNFLDRYFADPDAYTVEEIPIEESRFNLLYCIHDKGN